MSELISRASTWPGMEGFSVGKKMATVKINRRDLFAHAVPRKKQEKPKGVWVLWVIAGILLTACVVLPPKIKVVVGRSYAQPVESLGLVKGVKGGRREWGILGFDSGMCGVVRTLQEEGHKVNAIGIRQGLSCGSKGPPVKPFSSVRDVGSQRLRGGRQKLREEGSVDRVVIVGGERAKGSGSSMASNKRSEDDNRSEMADVVRVATWIARDEIIVMEHMQDAQHLQDWTRLLGDVGCTAAPFSEREQFYIKSFTGAEVQVYTCTKFTPTH